MVQRRNSPNHRRSTDARSPAPRGSGRTGRPAPPPAKPAGRRARPAAGPARSAAPTPPELKDANRGERLHKALADAGVGSRRLCEQLIAEGRVAINGQIVVDMPVWVDLGRDRVEVDGKHVAGRAHKGHAYILFHKPRRVVSTSSDPEGRRTVFDFVPHKERLFLVGRLDFESAGLILLTDDGDLANHLMHPRYEVPKTYEVTIKGVLSPGDAEKMRKGVWLADDEGERGVKAHAEDIQILDSDRERTRLRITLREGRNREIRRMMARLGHDVKRLTRIAIGPLQLKGVAVGGWRDLSPIELAKLRRAARGREE